MNASLLKGRIMHIWDYNFGRSLILLIKQLKTKINETN